MAKILILGAGSMGTAFSVPCSDNNHQVTIVGTHLEDNFIEKINIDGVHPALNCKIPSNVKFLKFDKLYDELNGEIDFIVIAVVSKGIDWAASQLSKIKNLKIPILILTKGLSINKINMRFWQIKLKEY